MNDVWVPELMQSRQAFLSTVCISSVHKDVMKGDEPLDNYATNGIRQEVVQLIHSSFDNPNTRASDLTIMAVLHLMTSDIILGYEAQLRNHDEGLVEMIRLRGTLSDLKVGGQLALLLAM